MNVETLILCEQTMKAKKNGKQNENNFPFPLETIRLVGRCSCSYSILDSRCSNTIRKWGKQKERKEYVHCNDIFNQTEKTERN